MPSPQAVVGLTVTGTGASLVPPAAPTVVPYSTNCGALVDKGFDANCVMVSAPRGQIAALVEHQQTPSGGESERDVVWARVGATWQLALRRAVAASDGSTEVEASDVMHDGDTKAVFAMPAGNPEYADEVDVVEPNGTVSLSRRLHGGYATVSSGGGLLTSTPSAPPAQGYDEALIRYADGHWTITSVTQVSQTEAQGQADGPFDDPSGTRATFFPTA